MRVRVANIINKIITFLVGEPVVVQKVQQRGNDGRFKKR